MSEWGLAIRFARREMRSGLSGFRIFFACLVLGVAAIAGIDSLADALLTGLAEQGRTLLGGDIAVDLVHRPAGPRELAFLKHYGRVSATISMRAMAYALKDGKAQDRQLVELKAVDRAWPLYGTAGLSPADPLPLALACDATHCGALVEASLLDRLHLTRGDTLRIGDAEFRVAAVLTGEPDRIAGGFSLGPHVLVSDRALARTGLVTTGSLIEYGYRVALPARASLSRFRDDAHAAFPDGGWDIRDRNNAAPGLRRFVEQVTMFLTLVGLTALAVGGVGAAQAIAAFLDRKRNEIATLKALGAEGGTDFSRLFYPGDDDCARGAGRRHCRRCRLAVRRAGRVRGRTSCAGAFRRLSRSSRVCRNVRFAVGGRIRHSAARARPRDHAGKPVPRHGRAQFGARAAALSRGCGSRRSERGRARACPRAFGILCRVVPRGHCGRADRSARNGICVACSLARIAPSAQPLLRLALANLTRPGGASASVVVALGLGLTLLAAVTVLDATIAAQVSDSLPAKAPSFFFVDIQPGEIAAFDATIARFPSARDYKRTPMIRGRITALNGVPAEQARVAAGARWVLNGDRGISYAAAPPGGTELTAGAWWPADYRGPLRISFDAELAPGLGLKLGDTITLNVLGRELTGTIANFRHVDFSNGNQNFVLILSPGLIDRAPHSFLATVRVAPRDEEPLYHAITDRFRGVSTIRVKDAIAQVNGLLQQLSDGCGRPAW